MDTITQMLVIRNWPKGAGAASPLEDAMFTLALLATDKVLHCGTCIGVNKPGPTCGLISDVV